MTRKKTLITLTCAAVLGSYSATAPYACAKSKRIFELGCASLAKRMADEKTYTKRLGPISRALRSSRTRTTASALFRPYVGGLTIITKELMVF